MTTLKDDIRDVLADVFFESAPPEIQNATDEVCQVVKMYLHEWEARHLD